METVRDIQVLGEEDGDDEEELISNILKDKLLMESINTKLKSLNEYLESDKNIINNAESLFDEYQVLKEDRSASNIIEKSQIYALDKDSDKTLLDQRIDLRMVTGISHCGDTVAVS